MLDKGLGENAEFTSYHPLVNLCYFALVIGITMFSLSPYFLAAAFLGSWIYSVMLRGRAAVKWNLSVSIAVPLVMIGMNMLFNHNGATVLLYINGNRITLESAVYGCASGVMLVAVIIWFSCFNTVMTADKLIYLFGKAAPVLGLTLSMIFRFIPLLKSRYAEISMGQKCMGRSYAGENLLVRARQMVKKISILIAWSLESSIETGDSMEARGYGLRGRTGFHLYKFTARDGKALLGFAAAGIPAAAAAVLQITDMTYYPKLIFPEMSLPTVGSILCCAVLMAIPMGIDLAGERKWKQENGNNQS